MLKDGSLKPKLTSSSNDSVAQIGAYMLFIVSGRFSKPEADNGLYADNGLIMWIMG